MSWELLKDKKFLHSTAILIGTMVGVGIFGIPLAFAKAGFWVGVAFLIITCLATLCITLAYSEIVLRTEGRHQLIGYVNLYLGAGAKRIVFFTNTLAIYGALLAYIVVAGQFLYNIFSYFFYAPIEYYSTVFFALAAGAVRLGLKSVAGFEFAMTALLIIVVVVIFGLGAMHIQLVNFTGFSPGYWFLPYGVLLFAFSGMSSVPMQREILQGEEKKLKRSIILATGIVALLYLVFALTVVGVSGEITTPDALSGLYEILGSKIIILGSIFGIMAISASFILLGISLMDVFHFDYKVRSWPAWLLVIIPPFLLYTIGQRDFIAIINLVGAVAIGLEPPILLYALHKARKEGTRTPEYTFKMPTWTMAVISVLFVAGAVYAFFPK